MAAKKNLVVSGPAVVLRTEDGSERYLYKGAPVGDGFTKASVDHAVNAGLVSESKVKVEPDPAESKDPEKKVETKEPAKAAESKDPEKK